MPATKPHMLANTPDTSQAGFLAVLDKVISALSNELPFLGGSIPCATRTGDADEKVCNVPRILLPSQGRQRYAISNHGNRTDVVLEAGQCVYLAPNAWSIDFWDIPGDAFGMVLASECVRMVQAHGAGDSQPPRVFAYHTAAPLSGAGLMACRALNHLAEEGGDIDGARDFMMALLRCVRRHLRDDGVGTPNLGRAQITWRAAHAYLEEHFARPVTRESLADALDLHPNYISVLCRRVAGQSFQEILDGIRTQHAQRLLRDTDLKIDRIARLCGYSKATSLAKAFRRATGTTPGQFRKLATRPKGRQDEST
jgi:AraC-like DNA-binding protein